LRDVVATAWNFMERRTASVVRQSAR